MEELACSKGWDSGTRHIGSLSMGELACSKGWDSGTRHLGSLSMEELACSKGWDSGKCNVGIDSSLLASLVDNFPSNPNLV